MWNNWFSHIYFSSRVLQLAPLPACSPQPVCVALRLMALNHALILQRTGDAWRSITTRCAGGGGTPVIFGFRVSCAGQLLRRQMVRFLQNTGTSRRDGVPLRPRRPSHACHQPRHPAVQCPCFWLLSYFPVSHVWLPLFHVFHFRLIACLPRRRSPKSH